LTSVLAPKLRRPEVGGTAYLLSTTTLISINLERRGGGGGGGKRKGRRKGEKRKAKVYDGQHAPPFSKRASRTRSSQPIFSRFLCSRSLFPSVDGRKRKGEEGKKRRKATEEERPPRLPSASCPSAPFFGPRYPSKKGGGGERGRKRKKKKGGREKREKTSAPPNARPRPTRRLSTITFVGYAPPPPVSAEEKKRGKKRGRGEEGNNRLGNHRTGSG